uniref:KIB1-4 beta-propeller domain-containing protein n=1 Tax=Hordeum vulgare subsp. vulgare TaxID=112509 RepID=A0A8I6WBI5_HORVV
MASSLPGDVVRLLGDLFLATDDVDYYMTMRGVCHGWRVSTDDPKDNPADPRFRLRRWVMLDERRPKCDEDERAASGRLFLNTATGRRVYKRLPRLEDYYFITSTGGLIVLASKASPHVVRVMNLFTDSSIRFAALIPDSVRNTTAYLREVDRIPTLVLDDLGLQDKAYTAELDAEHFAVEEYNLVDKVRTIWGIDAADQDIISGLVRSITTVLPYKMYFSYTCYHILESAGDMLIVIHRRPPCHGVDVFKANVEEKAVEPVRSIGSRALFLGNRCVSVDTNKFPTIEGNRIFYFVGGGQDDKGNGICMFDLTNETHKWITSAVLDFTWCFGEHTKPTIIQTLMKYCIDIPWVAIGV